MKKITILFIAVLMLLSALSASKAASGLFEQMLQLRAATEETPEAHEDDIYVKNTVFHFADAIATVSFAEVRQYLVDQGYSFRETIGNNKLATFNVECPVGEIYFCFYPMDISYTSTAFGDPDREMLSCIEYERDDKWISITDDLHIHSTKLKACNKSDDPANHEISDINMLRIFYNYEIGGNIAHEESADVTIITDAERLLDIHGVVSSCIEKYTGTTIINIFINQNVSTSDPDDFILQVYLRWDVLNNAKRTKMMLEMYSDELATTLGERYSDAKNIYIFWEVPYLLENGTAAKYEYRNSSHSAYIIRRTGPLYN